MGKIYVITSGEYSDYGIDGIYSTKELADKFLSTFNHRDARIEEWELDSFKDEFEKGPTPFTIRMTKEGECLDVSERGDTFDPEYAIRFDYVGNMYACVFAKDSQHAIKIANEKRVQLIENNTWNHGK